jgi:virulence-associated protein VapD
MKVDGETARRTEDLDNCWARLGFNVTSEQVEVGAAVIEQLHGVVDAYFLAAKVYSAMESRRWKRRGGG